MASLKEYRLEQIAQLDKLRALGIDPYPATVKRDRSLASVSKDFEKLSGREVWLVGRLMSIRQHGQITFLDLRDQSGRLQLIVAKESLLEADRSNQELQYGDLSLLTRGDFINVFGEVGYSQRREMSLRVSRLRIVCKVLRPLPLKLLDTKIKRQRRYLDLAINDEVRQRFKRRSLFWRNVRHFLDDKGFLEINIPVLEQTTGGAEARPFKTHMRALDQDFYLRISHELPLKKLLGGGYEKIYDIGPRFRNEHYSDEHLPEHIAMEWYWAYADWQDGMQLMEEMFADLARKTFGSTQFTFLNKKVDLSQSWQRLDYQQLMQEHYQIDVLKTSIEEVNSVLKKHRLEAEKTTNLAAGVDKLFKNIRSQMAGPYWLINQPLYLEPLSKCNPQHPELAQRFQAILGGSEVCKGFSELNDPQEQLQRLEEQRAYRQAGDEEAQMLDIDFVEMLEYGMPPACGLGFSERLFWFLEGVPARDGIPFNQMRRETDETTAEIYPQLF